MQFLNNMSVTSESIINSTNVISSPNVTFEAPVRADMGDRSFYPTGYSLVIPLPFVRLDDEPIALWRQTPDDLPLLSWKPAKGKTAPYPVYNALLQAPYGKHQGLPMIYTRNIRPHHFDLINNRFSHGNVDTLIRVQSSTGVTGSLAVVQIDDVVREAQSETEGYLGLLTAADLSFQAQNPSNFVINDLSQQKHFAIESRKPYRPVRRDHKYLGLAYDDPLLFNQVSPLFSESLLAIYPVGDLQASQAGSTIRLDFYNSYKNVTFETKTWARGFADVYQSDVPILKLNDYYVPATSVDGVDE